MRAHPQNSDTANTLNKNESCKAIRIDLNLISFAKKMALLLALTFQISLPKSSLSRQYFALNAILILDTAYTRG
jgi:hypothetical protein